MSSSYNPERFATETQLQRDAEYILENVLHRKRYSSITRDNLASKLDMVARGVPLKKGRTPQKTNRHQ